MDASADQRPYSPGLKGVVAGETALAMIDGDKGRLLYRGDDTYLSRDYRFLGSIGYFDALYLPLIQGENELLLAVSEDLGGWGVQAKLENLAGLTLVE